MCHNVLIDLWIRQYERAWAGVNFQDPFRLHIDRYVEQLVVVVIVDLVVVVHHHRCVLIS